MTKVVAPPISNYHSWLHSDLKTIRNRVDNAILDLDEHKKELQDILDELDYHLREVDKAFAK